MKVLVIEDDNTIARAITITLSKYGHEYLHVRTLKEFKEEFDEYFPDAIILDLGLPDSFGVETVINVKNVIYPETLVIIYTANDYVFNEVMDIGVDNFLVKGHFKPSDLPNILNMAKINHKFHNVLNKHKKMMDGEETTWPGKSIDTDKIGDGLILIAQELKTVVESG